MTKSIIRLLSLTAAMLAVSGCIEELSPDFGSEPQLVLNADLMTGRTEHAVYLTVGTPEGLVAPASDSRILCYVNGELVAEDSQGDVQEYEEQFLVFDISADFKAGDRVKLVAESGDMSAYAENVFPEPCEVSVDSSSVRSEVENWMHTVDGDYVTLPYGRVYSFRMTVKDLPGRGTKFQTLLPELWVQVGDDAPSKYIEMAGSDFYDEHDPVFENVFSPIPTDVAVATGLSFSILNYSRIFSDRLFSGGEYSFDFDRVVDQGDIFGRRYPYQQLIRSYVRFSVATVNDADWQFYQYINSYTGSSELSEPVSTVSNVVGGSGYVTALGMSDLVMELKPLDWSLQ